MSGRSENILKLEKTEKYKVSEDKGIVENRISLLYLLTERQNVFACMVTNVSIQVTVGSVP